MGEITLIVILLCLCTQHMAGFPRALQAVRMIMSSRLEAPSPNNNSPQSGTDDLQSLSLRRSRTSREVDIHPLVATSKNWNWASKILNPHWWSTAATLLSESASQSEQSTPVSLPHTFFLSTNRG